MSNRADPGVILLFLAGVTLAFWALGCAGTKQRAGKPASAEESMGAYTNWFGTNVTAEVKAATNSPGLSVPPDNTARNKRDADSEALTPLNQGGNDTDRQITAALRKEIVFAKEHPYSFSAKNIKIITINNDLTLRGVVASQEEKERIGESAKRIPGVKLVHNLLEARAGGS